MPTSVQSDLTQEWNTLQNNIEQYEKSSLLIKLTAVVLCAIGSIFSRNAIMMSMLVGVLWIQESVFRTFQARLAERIVKIEQIIKQAAPTDFCAYQLHSAWLAARPDAAGLIQEYLANMLRPTVAFPYVALILIDFASLVV